MGMLKLQHHITKPQCHRGQQLGPAAATHGRGRGRGGSLQPQRQSNSAVIEPVNLLLAISGSVKQPRGFQGALTAASLRLTPHGGACWAF